MTTMKVDCLIFWKMKIKSGIMHFLRSAYPVFLYICSAMLAGCGSEKPPVAQGTLRQPVAGSATQKFSLAVFPCKAVKPVTEEQAQQARDFLEEEVARQKIYRLVDRAEIDKVSSEAALGMQGFVDSDQAVQAGKFIAAQFILTSKLSLVGTRYMLSCRLVNTQSGEVTNSAMGRVSDIAKLDGAAKGCVRRLFNLM